MALQTKDVFETLSKAHGKTLACFVGGTNMKSEAAILKVRVWTLCVDHLWAR